ncbi:hypothetical protein GCM10027589_08430 [Actinocorallia lasiicapitis]
MTLTPSTPDIPAAGPAHETGWDTAPSLLDGAMTLQLAAAETGLRYWFQNVPQGTLRGHVDGHDPALVPPAFMREPGPLRDALTQEYAFRAIAEDKAARGLAYLVPIAPDLTGMEFYVTQVMDEARHAMVFRNHLLHFGVTPDGLDDALERFAGKDKRSILDPLEEYALKVMRDDADYIGGVVMMTIIIEGALAPAAELSERKWRPLDPAAADIDKGAGIDEIRHLTVGADIARQYLLDHPKEHGRVVELIRAGMGIWHDLPVQKMIMEREEWFQEGLLKHADVVGDYEIWPGRRLIDTTPEERQGTAERWSQEMKEIRLRGMGLEEALQ